MTDFLEITIAEMMIKTISPIILTKTSFLIAFASSLSEKIPVTVSNE